MSPWSSLGLSGCRGANVSNWKDLFHGVGDQSSALQSGAAALRLDVTTMTLPKHQDSAQSSIKALLASCVEVDSSLTWSLISRPGPTFQNLQFLINAFFSHFATNYSIAARILIHSLDLKGQRCMGYGRWKPAS